MNDLREKVTKGIECCAKQDQKTCFVDCPYYDEDEYDAPYTCKNNLYMDALELLKPAKAIRMHNTKVSDVGEKVFVAVCNNCSGYLCERWKACPICGKAVTWDAAD